MRVGLGLGAQRFAQGLAGAGVGAQRWGRFEEPASLLCSENEAGTAGTHVKANPPPGVVP